jgi:hypothetical protein
MPSGSFFTLDANSIRQGEKFPQDPMSPERRFTADPLSSFWSVRRRKRERRGGFGVLGFAYPEFQFKIVFVCKKACKTHQIVSRGF